MLNLQRRLSRLSLLIVDERFYNDLRPHQALGYRTPAEVFHGDCRSPFIAILN